MSGGFEGLSCLSVTGRSGAKLTVNVIVTQQHNTACLHYMPVIMGNDIAIHNSTVFLHYGVMIMVNVIIYHIV